MPKKLENEKERKVNTKIRIRNDYKELAKKEGVNFSQLMEESLEKLLKEKKLI